MLTQAYLTQNVGATLTHKQNLLPCFDYGDGLLEENIRLSNAPWLLHDVHAILIVVIIPINRVDICHHQLSIQTLSFVTFVFSLEMSHIWYRTWYSVANWTFWCRDPNPLRSPPA